MKGQGPLLAMGAKVKGYGEHGAKPHTPFTIIMG